MTAPDVFGVIVRTFGLAYTFYGLYMGLWAMNPNQHGRRNYLFACGASLAAGLILFLGANWIVRLTYG